MSRFLKKYAVAFLAACLLLTGCSGGDGSSSYSVKEATKEAKSGQGFDYMTDEAVPAAEESADAGADSSAGDKAKGESNSVGNKQSENTTNKIDKEKLVFRCNMSIDTLEYADSVKKFRDLIKKYEGFVETETETDDKGMDSYYYYRDINPTQKKHSTYTATVRIPSAKYDDFLEETGGIGEVRNKTANVENVSQSYYSLQAELEVLEAKYQRYLEMLKKATTTKDIIDIENTITSIEVQINQIKTQLNRYDNDVAYSYVSVSIKEVEKIVQEEEKGTVSNAFEDSLKAFGNVCHGLFIIFIYFLPYLIVILVILLIVFFATMPVRKKHKAAKKAAKENAAKAPQNPVENPPVNTQAPPVNPQAGPQEKK